MSATVLKTSRLCLRPATPDDIERRYAIGPEPAENLRLYGIDPAQAGPFTRQSAIDWVDMLARHSHAWVIEADGIIGSIRLDRIDPVDRRASLAIGLLRPEHQGRGYGTEATRCLLQHAFFDLGLHRVSLRVLALNGRAIRSYEKAGFRVEGRERETAYLDGQWQDDLIMGILAPEFAATDP